MLHVGKEGKLCTGKRVKDEARENRDGGVYAIGRQGNVAGRKRANTSGETSRSTSHRTGKLYGARNRLGPIFFPFSPSLCPSPSPFLPFSLPTLHPFTLFSTFFFLSHHVPNISYAFHIQLQLRNENICDHEPPLCLFAPKTKRNFRENVEKLQSRFLQGFDRQNFYRFLHFLSVSDIYSVCMDDVLKRLDKNNK